MRIFTTHIGLVAFELLMIARALIAASLLSISVVAWAETSLTGSSAVDPLAPLDTDEWTVVQGAPLQLGRDQPPAWVQLLKSIRPTGEDGIGRPLHAVNLVVTANGRLLYSFAPPTAPSRDAHRTDLVYYLDDRGLQAGCPLEVRDVTGDGTPEILFHSGYAGASDWMSEIHVLKYTPEDPKHFRDVRAARFAESWWQKLRWANRGGVSLAIVADPIERSGDPEVACHACPKFHRYEVYRWNEARGSFVLEETIPSTGTLHRDDENPLDTDWSYIESKVRQ